MPCMHTQHQSNTAQGILEGRALSQLKTVSRPQLPAATKAADAAVLSADTDSTVPTLTSVQAATVDVITFCMICTAPAKDETQGCTAGLRAKAQQLSAAQMAPASMLPPDQPGATAAHASSWLGMPHACSACDGRVQAASTPRPAAIPAPG